MVGKSQAATSQSYFIEAVLFSNFERSPPPGFIENQKMVLVNGHQYQIIHLLPKLQQILRFSNHPISYVTPDYNLVKPFSDT